MNITLIAAVGENRELGLNNNLIWHIPEDMIYFRDNTLNKPIIMGYNTFISLPKRLVKREYIILTHRNISYDDVYTFDNVISLLDYIKQSKREFMVIGGAKVYEELMDYANKMLLTEIMARSEASVYFPAFSLDEWDREVLSYHNYKGMSYQHTVYTRKKSLSKRSNN